MKIKLDGETEKPQHVIFRFTTSVRHIREFVAEDIYEGWIDWIDEDEQSNWTLDSLDSEERLSAFLKEAGALSINTEANYHLMDYLLDGGEEVDDISVERIE